MSKCLKCGAALPPVGDCPACATAVSKPAPSGVPGLLDKDILIDRRRTPEHTPAVSGVEVPGFSDLVRGPATPPGLTPLRPPPMPQRAAAPDPSADITQSDPSTAITLPAEGLPLSQLAAAPAPAAEAPTAMATAAQQTGLPVPPSAPPAPPLAPEPVTSSRSPRTPVPVVTFSPPSRMPSPPLPGSISPEELTPRIPHPTIPPLESSSAAPRPRPAAQKAAPGVQEIHARPASLWRRLLSFSIDTAAIVGVATLYITLASSIAGVKAPSSQGLTALDSFAAWMHALKSVLLPGAVLLLVLATVYCAVAAFLWNGRTLGRLLLGLRLVDTHGLAPAPTRAIVRALLSVVSFGLFLGGFWMALFDRRGQTLHDKLTSTFVVQPS